MPARDQNLILAFGSNKQTGVGVVSTTFNQFLKIDRDIPFLRYGTETDEDWVGKATEFAFNVYPTAYDFSSKIEKNASAEFTCWAWAYAMGVAGYATSLYTLTPLVPATTIEMIYFSMAAKLADKKGIFRDTLVTNIVELCQILPALNLTGDAQLEKLRQQAEQLVKGLDPQDLREVPAVRRATAKKAREIQDTMADFLGAAAGEAA